MAKKRKRAASVTILESMKFDTFTFSPKWAATLGELEKRGVWMIGGGSGNGKTTCVIQLIIELCQFGKVIYNPLEEGLSLSLQRVAQQQNLRQVNGKVLILDKEPIEDLQVRLRKRYSPNIVIIDSIQYTGLNRRTFFPFINEFPNKLFIFITQIEGKKPKGRLADDIWYHANFKGMVEGYKLFSISRGNDSDPYVIWDKGAAEYWGEVTL